MKLSDAGRVMRKLTCPTDGLKIEKINVGNQREDRLEEIINQGEEIIRRSRINRIG